MSDIRAFEGPQEAGFGDYVQLLKPRVMSLVVFTALAAMIVAPGAIHPVVAAAALLCIAVGAGAAGATGGGGSALAAVTASSARAGEATTARRAAAVPLGDSSNFLVSSRATITGRSPMISVMSASSRNRERVDCRVLANDIADVRFLRWVFENRFDLGQLFVRWRAHRNCCPVKVCDLTETAGADDIHVIDQKRLSKVLLWNDGTAKPGSLRSQQRRQDSGDGAKRAIKSEFSQMQCLGNALGVQFATGGQYRDSNSQIES